MNRQEIKSCEFGMRVGFFVQEILRHGTHTRPSLVARVRDRFGISRANAYRRVAEVLDVLGIYMPDSIHTPEGRANTVQAVKAWWTPERRAQLGQRNRERWARYRAEAA